MKITKRLAHIFGLGVLRTQPAPEPLLIADGLVITDRQAIAWIEIGTENTDLVSEDRVDHMLDQIGASAPPLLEGKQCHLKVVWSRVDGAQYLAELGDRARPWDHKRAAWLDEYEINERRALLGVVIDENRQSDGAVIARRKARHALGLPPGRISDKELRYLHARVRELAKSLNNTSWKVSLAPVETIAWLHSRELHRETIVPNAGTIAGAGLGRLTSGRVVPYSDHLETLGPAGEVTQYVAVLAISGFPEHLEVPGDQEWLRILSEIHRVDATGQNVRVNVDASVRFAVLSDADAQKRVKDSRDLAKEQRQSAAKHSTGETSVEIEDTEAEMNETLRRLNREDLRLVEAHPRLIVSEASIEDLTASVNAVKSHYQKVGFGVHLALDEQRELWMEALPCDQLRVTDLGHTIDATSFFGGWWWGGSVAGQAPGNRMIGYLTGSTPGIVRSDVTSGARRGDATTTVYAGRSGRGKTTAMMIDALNAAADLNTWVAWLSLKGDDLGIAEVARTECGADAGVVSVGAEHAGAADLFRTLPVDDAKLTVGSQLQLLAPASMAGLAETVLPQVIEQYVQSTDEPSTWGVILALINYRAEENVDASDVDVRRRTNEVHELGRIYRAYASTPLGAPLLGHWAGTDALPKRPGLWVAHFPTLVLPRATMPVERWDQSQRLSVALIRAFTMHALAVSGDDDLRSMPKLVSVPEVHRLLNTDDGLDFLDQIARMGRARHTSLQMDLQDLTTIQPHEGLVEQISTLHVFQLTTRPEQEAAATMCAMEPEDAESRATFYGIGVATGVDEVRKGHSVMRDPSGRPATVQWLIPDEHVRELLDTTPDTATAPDHDGDLTPSTQEAVA